MSHHPRRAFSLIELAVVLIVIAVIAAIAIPTFQSVISESEDNAAEAEVNATMRNAVAIARANNRLTPNQSDLQTAFDEIATAATAGLSAAASGYTVCAQGVEGTDCGAGVDVWWDEDAGVLGVVVDDTIRTLARIQGQSVTDTWVDPSGTLADALAGPSAPPAPVPQAAAEPYLVLFGLSGSSTTPAIDDLRVTNGSATVGPAVYLADNLDRLTGLPVHNATIQTITTDPALANQPLLSAFGVAPGRWAVAAVLEAPGTPGVGHPVVTAGSLVGSGASTVDQLLWSLTAGNIEASFVLDTAPAPGQFASVQVASIGHWAAYVTIVNGAAVASAPNGCDNNAAPAPVQAGDRIGIRRIGSTWSLVINGSVAWTGPSSC